MVYRYHNFFFFFFIQQGVYYFFQYFRFDRETVSLSQRPFVSQYLDVFHSTSTRIGTGYTCIKITCKRRASSMWFVVAVPKDLFVGIDLARDYHEFGCVGA